jgi:citrate lyase beta subunit
MIDDLLRELDRRLARADHELSSRFPGGRRSGRPVHTVYVPADAYDADTVTAYGQEALSVLDQCADVLNADDEVRDRARVKLSTEPVEDLRVDFEDGYGMRPARDEDADARRVASALPPTRSYGIRIKSLEPATRARGLRTLEVFLSAAARVPVVTLPKVTSVAQVEAMVFACEWFENTYAAGPLRFELQIETPQSVLGPDGTALLARMIHASAGRCAGLHYGTYDYSTALDIAPAHQSMEHPVADYAKAVMQAAAAGTGVPVCDGSTNVLPIGPHATEGWMLHARLVRRSLERGFYQGWDMHPAQLPSRYLATYAFFREGAPMAIERLRAYVGDGTSGHLDEPATAAALAGFLLRGVDCGALDLAELGVDPDMIRRFARREGGVDA